MELITSLMCINPGNTAPRAGGPNTASHFQEMMRAMVDAGVRKALLEVLKGLDVNHPKVRLCRHGRQRVRRSKFELLRTYDTLRLQNLSLMYLSHIFQKMCTALRRAIGQALICSLHFGYDVYPFQSKHEQSLN